MTLIISDANILIDMEVAGLLEAMFQLPERFAVPDLLYVEELEEQHADLPGYGLLVLEMPSETIGQAQQLRAKHAQPGQMDLNALALAMHQACPLLTGDRRLREAAEQEQVRVNGTLWLMEQLLQVGIITLTQMEHAYDAMRQANRRLPWQEVSNQIRRLKRQHQQSE